MGNVTNCTQVQREDIDCELKYDDFNQSSDSIIESPTVAHPLKYKCRSNDKNSPNYTLDITLGTPDTPLLSWNCHQRLEQIEQRLIQTQANYEDLQTLKSKNKTAANLTKTSTCAHNIELSLEWITGDISRVIYGITHNFLSSLPNERALLDYWQSEAQSYPERSVVVFELSDSLKIQENLGWESCDEIIQSIAKMIKQYMTCFGRQHRVKFKLFHPEFNVSQFIVVVHNSDSEFIMDFCYCVLSDVARRVKCFFQQTTVWAGFALDADAKSPDHQSDDDSDTVHNSMYAFRVCYERAKVALAKCQRLNRFTDVPEHRIMEWLPSSERLKKGKQICDLIQLLYASQYGGMNRYSSFKKVKIEQVLEDIGALMKQGADLNYSDHSGNTPVFYAIAIKNEQVIRYLLEFDFDADQRNNNGESMLIQAIKKSIDESICVHLAQRTKYAEMPDNSNRSAFVYALNKGYFKVMDILAKKGATDYKRWIMELCNDDSHILLAKVLNDNHIRFDITLDDSGRNILHYAVLYQSTKVLKHFLKNNLIRSDIADTCGWSAVHYAAAKGYLNIVKLLIGFDDTLLTLKTTKQKFTPFRIALNHGHESTAMYLRSMMVEQMHQQRTHLFCALDEPSNVSEQAQNAPTLDHNHHSRPLSGLLSTVSTEYTTGNDDDGDSVDLVHNNNEIDTQWNRENQDNNAENAQNCDKRKSGSHSRNTNSENAADEKPQKRDLNVLVIDENVVRDEYDLEQGSNGPLKSDRSSLSSDSGRTRVIHRSFSDSARCSGISENDDMDPKHSKLISVTDSDFSDDQSITGHEHLVNDAFLDKVTIDIISL